MRWANSWNADQANLSMQNSIPANVEPIADAALAQQQFQQYQHQQSTQAMMTRRLSMAVGGCRPNGFKGGDRPTVEDPRDMRKYMITIPKNAVAGNVLL